MQAVTFSFLSLLFTSSLLLGGCSASVEASGDDDATESTASELSAAQCRRPANADREDCRLRGTVTRTYLQGSGPAATCILYVRDERTRYVYGIVETGDCRYTRAFDGLAPAPFNEIWTRFADTQAVPTVEARRLREKDPFGNPISFVRLLHGAEIHGDVPGAHDGDVTRAIADAVSPLGGADPALTKSIAIADAPTSVRSALTAASNEIENRTFEGTDYSAGVEGIYIVYDSPAKTNIVAYVVYGTGSGEPDYHDGIVIGFDANGTRIYDESDSG